MTNDFTQDSTQTLQEVCALRWMIEQSHPETIQLTGLEGCQYRAGSDYSHSYQVCHFGMDLSPLDCRGNPAKYFSGEAKIFEDTLSQKMKTQAIRMSLVQVL
ncbi:MAG: hypothetical protein AB9891_12345 [Anaerolineaceae bacterium]